MCILIYLRSIFYLGMYVLTYLLNIDFNGIRLK